MHKSVINIKSDSYIHLVFVLGGTFWVFCFVLFCFVFLFVCLIFETRFLCVTALAVPELALVDQAGLKLTDSDSQVLGLKACTTTAPPIHTHSYICV